MLQKREFGKFAICTQSHHPTSFTLALPGPMAPTMQGAVDAWNNATGGTALD